MCDQSPSIKGRLPSKVILRQRSSFVKGLLRSKVVFHQSSSSVKGHLYFIPSNLISFFKSNSIQFNLMYQVWHSSAQPFIFFLFELVDLNDLHYLSLRAGPRQWPQWQHRSMSQTLDLDDLNDDVVVEVDVKEALKSSIFIVQKAAAPKSGVEFCQGSSYVIRRLATLRDVARRRTT